MNRRFHSFIRFFSQGRGLKNHQMLPMLDHSGSRNPIARDLDRLSAITLPESEHLASVKFLNMNSTATKELIKGIVARDLFVSVFFMDLLYIYRPQISRLKGFSFLFHFRESIRIFRWIRAVGKLETIYWHQAGAFPAFNSSFALPHSLTKSASDLKIARICSGWSENSATWTNLSQLSNHKEISQVQLRVNRVPIVTVSRIFWRESKFFFPAWCGGLLVFHKCNLVVSGDNFKTR